MKRLRFILPLFIVSCARLPLSTSYWENSKRSNEEVLITYFDSEHKLRCMVRNDSTSLYVSFDTDDKSVKRWIFQSGAVLYIDTTGKKSMSTYLKYPLEPVFPKARKEETGFRQVDYKEQNRKLLAIPPTLAYSRGKGEQLLDFILEKKAGFNVNMVLDSAGYLTYAVKIPLTFLNPGGYRPGKPFSVGLKIEAPAKAAVKEPERDLSSGAGMGRGGMGVGGGRGGAMRPMSSSEPPVNIWFVTSLAVKP